MFKLSDVASAVGIAPRTLSTWLDRRIIAMGPDDVDEGCSGKPRQFSFARIMQIGLAFEMVQLGLNPTRAAEAASFFSDCSQPGRDAGELFPEGRTHLVLTTRETKVINVHPPAWDDHWPAIVIDVGEIFGRVSAALGDASRRAA